MAPNNNTESDNVLDLKLEELPDNYKQLVQDAVEHYQRRCMMSFGKNRSGAIFQRSRMPRMLNEGEFDQIEAQKMREYEGVVHKAVADNMTNQNGCILATLRYIMIDIYGQV